MPRYSRFPVGAALRAEDGSIHAGANAVENAAYPEGLCSAEAAAIAAMVTSERASRSSEMVVLADGPPLCAPVRRLPPGASASSPAPEIVDPSLRPPVRRTGGASRWASCCRSPSGPTICCRADRRDRRAPHDLAIPRPSPAPVLALLAWPRLVARAQQAEHDTVRRRPATPAAPRQRRQYGLRRGLAHRQRAFLRCDIRRPELGGDRREIPAPRRSRALARGSARR